MPPLFTNLRSRTNSLLDSITGAIPEPPPNGTFKDRSLTCRRCGNRFRDVIELDRHFNLLPHHSDYSDSHDFENFTRPRVRRQRAATETKTTALEATAAPSSPNKSTTTPTSPISGFSESEAFYAPPIDKSDKENKPAFLRKFSSLALVKDTGERQEVDSPTSPSTDLASRFGSKSKGKAKATFPRMRREESFTQMPDSDEESTAPSAYRASRSTAPKESPMLLSAGNDVSALGAAEHLLPGSLRPTLPARPHATKSLPALPMVPTEKTGKNQDRGDSDSIASSSSFRTAGSSENKTEKSRLASSYRDIMPAKDGSEFSSKKLGASKASMRPRHASEADLLLSSRHDHDEDGDAPPSYHELHADLDSDPFADEALYRAIPPLPAFRSSHQSKGVVASAPTSPLSRFGDSSGSPWSRVPIPRVPMPSTSRNILDASDASAWHPRPVFPVTFAAPIDEDYHNAVVDTSVDCHPTLPTESAAGAMGSSSHATRRRRPPLASAGSTTMPPLEASRSYSSIPSPISPSTPSTAPFLSNLSPEAEPQSQVPTRADSSKSTRRHTSRSKSESNPASTRCPTCFVKYPNLASVLVHLDSSECGAVEFESGIM